MPVTSLEILEQTPLWGGRPFGSVGPYERLTGRVNLAVDPKCPANALIVDLGLVSRGSDGLIHFDADFLLVRPVKQRPGDERLLFDVPSRGLATALVALNAESAERPPTTTGREFDSGNGFLVRQGYTIASCGWQHDVLRGPGLLGLRAPEAFQDQERVFGPIMCEFQPAGLTKVWSLGEPGVRAYPTRDLVDPTAVITVRDHPDSPARVIPRDRWQFGRLEDGCPVPDPTSLYIADGFEAGKHYTCVYTALGAPVVGTGLLAVRDVAAWLKYGGAATGNPCAGIIRNSYAIGMSQSAQFLRHFLYLGLNQDEQDRQVFDGVLSVIAGARRGEFNVRFGQPSKTQGQYVGALFPFSDATQSDSITGKTDGLLARLASREKLPKLVMLDSAAEYWSRQASLAHIEVQGSRDIAPLETTRIYLMAGTQHGGGIGGLPLRKSWLGFCPVRSAENSIDYGCLLRAALVNLDRWVRINQEPPPSLYPRLDDWTAVAPDFALAFFWMVPGVRIPAEVPTLARLDFGPETDHGVLRRLPPSAGAPYASFVAAVDADGNEVAGIRHPDVAVPLATYTGWNLRNFETGTPDELLLQAGATLPFPRTAAERVATGDPRHAINERYASKENYLQRVRQASIKLVTERYLLAEDVEAIVTRAALKWDLFTGASEVAGGERPE